MKQIILFFLMVFIFSFSTCSRNTLNENDFITTVRNGTTTVIGYKGSTKDVIIPHKINDLSVTVIRDATFKNSQLTSVTIPKTVTEIGNRTFYSNQLTNVTIPNNVTIIGDNAFAENKLTSLTIPKSVTKIGGAAFSNNLLTSVTIPDGVISIGYAPFVFCPELTSINVSPKNPNYKSVEGVLYNKDGTTLVQWPAGITGTANIPKGVTSIGRSAFNGNKLADVIIPNSVISIERYAFGNNQLTNIIIPNSVVSIGDLAFANNQLTNVFIPGSVTSIGNFAFSNNKLTSITFEKNSVKLENQAGSEIIEDKVISSNLADIYARFGAGTYTRSINSNRWTRD